MTGYSRFQAAVSAMGNDMLRPSVNVIITEVNQPTDEQRRDCKKA